MSAPATTPNSTDKSIEEKILHILDNYPRISPSMLQITLGSGLPTAIWQPILHRLVTEGKVFKYHRSVKSPNGRMQPLTFISLSPDNSPGS